jgi:hypothetical protein
MSNKIKNNQTEPKKELKIQLSFRELLILRLFQISGTPAKRKEHEGLKSIAKEGSLFIEKYISHIHFNKRPGGGIQYNYNLTDLAKEKELKGELTTEQIERILFSEPVKFIVNDLLAGQSITAPKGKFKRSGHLTDQMLKYTYPKDSKGQLSIFESLEEATKKAIEIEGEVEFTEIVEGIRLSPSETKLIDSLCKLLHEKSQTLDPKKNNYYTGNLPSVFTNYGLEKDGLEKEKTQMPKLAFTLYELTQEYKGEDTISGKDLENVRTVLTELDNRKFLIKYTEHTKGKAGAWIKKEYEAYRKLIFVDKATLSYGVGDIESYKKSETIVLLNPIFRRQIDSKFILYPNDIQKRTAIAYGNDKVSSIALKLRDYLMREHSSKRYNPEITLEKLFYLLAEKWMRESRKTKVKQFTDKALETAKALGLLKSYEIKTGSTGEPKVIFTLNKDWE